MNWGGGKRCKLYCNMKGFANPNFAAHERELGVIWTITSGTASLFPVAIWKRSSVDNYWGSTVKTRNRIIMPLKESHLPTSWNVSVLLVTSKILKLEKAYILGEMWIKVFVLRGGVWGCKRSVCRTATETWRRERILVVSYFTEIKGYNFRQILWNKEKLCFFYGDYNWPVAFLAIGWCWCISACYLFTQQFV